MHTLERSHRTMRQADVRIQQNSSLGSLSWCSWRHRCKDSCNRDSCHHLAVINRCVQAICFARCYHMPRPLKVCGLFLFFKKKTNPKQRTVRGCPYRKQTLHCACAVCFLFLLAMSWTLHEQQSLLWLSLLPLPATSCHQQPLPTWSSLLKKDQEQINQTYCLSQQKLFKISKNTCPAAAFFLILHATCLLLILVFSYPLPAVPDPHQMATEIWQPILEVHFSPSQLQALKSNFFPACHKMVNLQLLPVKSCFSCSPPLSVHSTANLQD